MHQEPYCIHAGEVKILLTDINADMIERGIFFDLINELWVAGWSSQTVTIEAYAKQSGLEQSKISDLVAKLAPYKWLIEEFDLNTFEINLKSPILEQQQKNIADRIQKSQKETKKARQLREITEKNLMRLVADSKKDEEVAPRVAYLDSEDRSLSTYKGWLPTSRFEVNGEAYRVTECFMQELSDEFKDANIGEHLLSIHAWLSANTVKRKTLARMPEFIKFWLRNANSKTKPSGNTPADSKSTTATNEMTLEEALAQLTV